MGAAAARMDRSHEPMTDVKPGITIRPYCEADLQAVLDLFQAAVRVGAAAYYDAAQRDAWAPTAPDTERWQARLASAHTLLAERDGTLLGFLAFEPNGHIDLLFTSPEYTRSGVASALYGEAEARLMASGVNELFTEASHLARRFFEKQGYVVMQGEQVIRNGVALPRFRMHKRLRRTR